MVETREKTGCCKFCGQLRIIEKTEDEWLDIIQKTNQDAQQIADEEATLSCNCKEGSDYRAEEWILQKCHDNIEIMFRDNNPEIADVLQEAKRMVYRQNVKKINVSTYDGGTASMFRKQGDIVVRYTETHETEMQTGW